MFLHLCTNRALWFPFYITSTRPRRVRPECINPRTTHPSLRMLHWMLLYHRLVGHQLKGFLVFSACVTTVKKVLHTRSPICIPINDRLTTTVSTMSLQKVNQGIYKMLKLDISFSNLLTTSTYQQIDQT